MNKGFSGSRPKAVPRGWGCVRVPRVNTIHILLTLRKFEPFPGILGKK